MATCVAKIFALLCFFLLNGTSPFVQAEKHSLYYIYTGLSKPVELPGIYQFTAMGLLDDRQIDYYNSQEQRMIPKQTWMKQKMQEDYWEKGTQSRKEKEEWIHKNIDSLMECLKQNESDVHVLQWRQGCEVEQWGSETKHFETYCYDGEDFLSYDYKESNWFAPVNNDLITRWKWVNVPILNQDSEFFLEEECVDRLKKFIEYEDEEFRKASPPDVQVFASKSSDESKLKLTCMASGFYPRDVMMDITKNHTSLPQNEIKSTGIIPNHDGTFQLKNSVEISEDEKAEYDCYVNIPLSEPIIKKWDGKCQNCRADTNIIIIGVIIGGILLGFVALVFCVKKTGQESSATSSENTTPQEREAFSGENPADDLNYIQRKLRQKTREESY